jgi:hypothetical protein
MMRILYGPPVVILLLDDKHHLLLAATVASSKVNFFFPEIEDQTKTNEERDRQTEREKMRLWTRASVEQIPINKQAYELHVVRHN